MVEKLRQTMSPPPPYPLLDAIDLLDGPTLVPRPSSPSPSPGPHLCPAIPIATAGNFSVGAAWEGTTAAREGGSARMASRRGSRKIASAKGGMPGY